MLELALLFFVAFVFVVFATLQDIKTQEVNDWISFSLLSILLGIRFMYSTFTHDQYAFFLAGVFGLIITTLLGNALYYARFFAGGDAKLFIALGALIPLGYSRSVLITSFSWFLLLFFSVGAIYGFFWIVTLFLRNKTAVNRNAVHQFRAHSKKIILVSCLGIVSIIFGFIASGYLQPLFILLGLIVLLLPYTIIFARALEACAMYRLLPPSKLREGDWIVRSVRVGKTVISPSWEGLSLSNIQLLRKSKKKVLIKAGIPFVPVFLITLLLFTTKVFFF